MIGLRESLLSKTENKVGKVKALISSLGMNYEISNLNMTFDIVEKYRKWFDSDKLAAATKGMELISPRLEKMLKNSYLSQRMSKYGQSWVNVINLWIWIDNFSTDVMSVNYDNSCKLIDKMNEKLERDGIFKKEVKFRPYGMKNQGEAEIILSSPLDDERGCYGNTIVSFSIRKKKHKNDNT
jgi:hypothetical protein